LLGVDPERRFSIPPSREGLGAVERVIAVRLVVLHIYFGRFVTLFIAVKSTENHLPPSHNLIVSIE
jgi:hypothetical protein